MVIGEPRAIEHVQEIATRYLNGLRQGGPGDFSDYIQRVFRSAKIQPAIPQFQSFEVIGERPVVAQIDVLRTIEVKLLLCATGSWGPRWQLGTLRVIKEDETGKPSEDGEWGVCPASWKPEGKPVLQR